MKKAFYDEWGEEKLKQGIFVNEGLLLEQRRKEEEAAAKEIQILWKYRQKKIKKEQDQAAKLIQKEWK